MESMLEQKRALTLYAGEHGKRPILTADQWTLVGNLIDTLSPLEQVTLEMSRSDSSISCIIPSITVLKIILEVEGAKATGINTLRNTMLDSLKARFEKADQTKCLVLATLLEPRYRGHNCHQRHEQEQATLSEAEKQKRASSEDQGPDPKRIRVEEEEDKDASPSDMLEQMYANLLWAHGPTSEETDDEEEQQFTQQLDQYLREPLIDRHKGQPLEWWKQNASRLHLLAPLARKFLSPPPSSVPIERDQPDISQKEEQADERKCRASLFPPL